MTRRILCFGDSNTYGFDPCSYLGGRYPEEVRWTGVLQRCEPGWEVLNRGENGREIPQRGFGFDRVEELLSRTGGPDLMAVMLGGNDLLQGLSPEETGGRMEAFLSWLGERPQLRERGTRLALLSPPPMVLGAWVDRDELVRASARLAGVYGALARRRDAAFADAGAWGVGLALDGVHFTQEGHRTFARHVRTLFQGLLPGIFTAGPGARTERG